MAAVKMPVRLKRLDGLQNRSVRKNTDFCKNNDILLAFARFEDTLCTAWQFSLGHLIVCLTKH
ncbi:MAG TPA: hypothetical protein P5175_09835 [Anaerohalosphaeraceae bacterium]|nr:hypothetical protein [Anaerohalosphaeraceae bacterium]HRS72134.1 hypothetical protein [Anaerohalosphaeraceae bacterium]